MNITPSSPSRINRTLDINNAIHPVNLRKRYTLRLYPQHSVTLAMSPSRGIGAKVCASIGDIGLSKAEEPLACLEKVKNIAPRDSTSHARYCE